MEPYQPESRDMDEEGTKSQEQPDNVETRTKGHREQTSAESGLDHPPRGDLFFGRHNESEMSLCQLNR